MEEATALKGHRILVIEDDYLVAEVLASILERAGAKVVAQIGRIDQAMAFIESHSTEFDGAVLDVNLHGEKSYPLAGALAAREVGFVFATGYGANALDDDWRHYPCCEKPFDQKALIAAVASALKSSRR